MSLRSDEATLRCEIERARCTEQRSRSCSQSDRSGSCMLPQRLAGCIVESLLCCACNAPRCGGVGECRAAALSLFPPQRTVISALRSTGRGESNTDSDRTDCSSRHAHCRSLSALCSAQRSSAQSRSAAAPRRRRGRVRRGRLALSSVRLGCSPRLLSSRRAALLPSLQRRSSSRPTTTAGHCQALSWLFRAGHAVICSATSWCAMNDGAAGAWKTVCARGKPASSQPLSRSQRLDVHRSLRCCPPLPAPSPLFHRCSTRGCSLRSDRRAFAASAVLPSAASSSFSVDSAHLSAASRPESELLSRQTARADSSRPLLRTASNESIPAQARRAPNSNSSAPHTKRRSSRPPASPVSAHCSRIAPLE